MSQEFRSAYLKTTQTVLFEELVNIQGRMLYVGYTREYVKVAAESEENLVNRMITGFITDKIADDLLYMEIQK